MSQEQYNILLSNLLREKRTLAKLRVELEGRKGKLCRSCKGFGHLARNCRNRDGERKGATMPQNKFEILKSRVMQCGVEGRTIKSMRIMKVRCFRYREEGHKYRECLVWVKRKKEEKVVHVERPQKTQQEERPVCPAKGKAQEKERKLRRVEGSKAVRPMKGNAQQGEWKRSSWKTLRKRAEWYCGPTVPRDAKLWELGWHGQGAIITYLRYPRCGKGGCYAEDDWGQGVLSY